MYPGVSRILAKLDAYESRKKRLLLAVEFSKAAAIALVGIALAMAVDFFLLPSPGLRLLLSFFQLSLVLLFLGWRLSLVLTRRSSIQIAEEVEKRSGLFNEKLIAALSLAPQANNWMVSRIIQEAETLVESQDLSELVDQKDYLRARKVLTFCFIFFSLLAVIPGVSPLFFRALAPHAKIQRPGAVQITVLPGNAVVPEGTDVDVVSSVQPAKNPVSIVLQWSDGVKEEAVMLPGRNGSFAISLGKMRQSIEYSVKAGRSESERFRISLAVPPKIDAVEWYLNAPAYTGKKLEIIKGNEVQILEGTETSLKVSFVGEPLKTIEINLPKVIVKSNLVSWTGFPAKDTNIALNYLGQNGIRGTTELAIKVVKDLPPKVLLEWPNANFVSEKETIPVEVNASDDIGLSSVKLHLVTEGGYQQTLIESTSQVFYAALETLPLKAGEKVSLVGEAEDVKGQRSLSATNTFVIAQPDFNSSLNLLRESRSLLSEMTAQVEMFDKARDSYISLRQSAHLAETIRPELLYLEENLVEATDLLEALSTGLKKYTNSTFDEKFLKGFGTVLGDWSKAYEEIFRTNLHNALAIKATESAPLLHEGRDISTWALIGLREITNDFTALIRYLENKLGAEEAMVARARQERLLALVKAHDGWTAKGGASVEEMTQLPPGDLEAARLELSKLSKKIAIPDVTTASNTVLRAFERYSWGEPLAELNLVLQEISKVSQALRDAEQKDMAETMMRAWLEYLPRTVVKEESSLFTLAQTYQLGLAERTRAVVAAHRVALRGETAIKDLRNFARDIEFDHPATFITHVVSKYREEIENHRSLKGPVIPLGPLIVERLTDYRKDKLPITQYAALLEAERHRSLNAYPLALGYSELARDIGDLIIDPSLAVPLNIDKLRERAVALMERIPALGVEIPENKALLEQLAAKAREAADRAEKRPELRKELASTAVENKNDSKLDEAKSKLAREEVEVRKIFATMEIKISNLATSLHSGFSRIVSQLAEDAQNPAVLINTLAAQAHDAAILLQNEAAIPAAQEFRLAPTPAKAELGKRIARLVFDQHQAAEILDKMVQRKNEIQQPQRELNVESSPELATKTASGSSQNRADSAGELAEQAAAEALAAIDQAPDEKGSYAEAAEILAKAAMHGRLAAASSFAAASGSKASTADSADVESDTGRFQGEGGRGMELAIAPKGIDQTDWARLPDNIKRAIRQSGSIENYSPEMQEAIRAYFRKLAKQ